MTRDEARVVLEGAKYWHYRFNFPWGETTPTKPGWADRVEKRRRHFFLPLLRSYGGTLFGKTVLDLGCCQGYWSFECQKAGAWEVLGLDSCPDFVREAEAAAVTFGFHECRFQEANLEDSWKEVVGIRRHVTLLLGTLYHLRDPIRALETAMELTQEAILIDGEVLPSREPIFKLVPRYMEEPTTIRSGAKGTLRMVGSVPAITALLRDGGFKSIEILEPEGMPGDYHAGTTASILAFR